MIKHFTLSAILVILFGVSKVASCEGVQIRHEAWNKQVVINVPCAGDYPNVETFYSPPGIGECEVRVNTYDRFGPFVVSIDWPVGVVTPTIQVTSPAH